MDSIKRELDALRNDVYHVRPSAYQFNRQPEPWLGLYNEAITFVRVELTTVEWNRRFCTAEPQSHTYNFETGGPITPRYLEGVDLSKEPGLETAVAAVIELIDDHDDETKFCPGLFHLVLVTKLESTKDCARPDKQPECTVNCIPVTVNGDTFECVKVFPEQVYYVHSSSDGIKYDVLKQKKHCSGQDFTLSSYNFESFDVLTDEIQKDTMWYHPMGAIGKVVDVAENGTFVRVQNNEDNGGSRQTYSVSEPTSMGIDGRQEAIRVDPEYFMEDLKEVFALGYFRHLPGFTDWGALSLYQARQKEADILGIQTNLLAIVAAQKSALAELQATVEKLQAAQAQQPPSPPVADLLDVENDHVASDTGLGFTGESHNPFETLC